MKLVLTTHLLGQGGTDRVCVHLANGFAAAGFDTELLTFCAGGKAEGSLLSLLSADVRHTVLGMASGSRARDLRRGAADFVQYLRRVRPDCLLSTGNNMNWTTFAGLRRSGLRNTRLVLKTTNPIIRPKDGFFGRQVRRWTFDRAFARADLILTLSDPETAELRAAFPHASARIRTVANPYVTAGMLAHATPIVSDGPLVLGVGRLEAQKRFDLLIRGFAHLNDPNARLVILGDGGGRKRLEALIAELGLQDRVSLPGFVDDVSPWFARADVFALTSVYEGLPAVVLEAMAANCPVVTTNCFPAAPTLVGTGDGCAVLTEPCERSLARLIEAALGRPRPLALQKRALTYRIDHAQRSHVDAVSALFTSERLPRPS